MKLQAFLAAGLFLLSTAAFAQVQVQGYYRANGTYVKPYVRSNPNSTRSDNYGAAQRSTSSPYVSSYVSPYSRDKDNDGVANQYDQDDDNDGTSDDYDSTP